MNINTNTKEKFYTRIFFVVVFVFVFFFLPTSIKADVLLPGNISTCGELAVPGTYTITQNITGGSDTCFLVSSDNIIIEGGGFTITGTASTAIDARAYTSSILTEGANGYTNLVINDLTLSGYTTGINLSGNSDLTGNGVNNGYAGDSGDLAIYYSVVGSVISNGGNSSSQNFGGLGGNIAFTDTNLNVSNSSIEALGGTGISGKNTDGGVDVNYSGTLTNTNTLLSSFSYFNDNAVSYGIFPGGLWPLLPGNISTCGTLYATTTSTFTLTQDISNISGTCFTLFGNDITIDGAGYSISSATSTNTSFAISAGSYSNFTLASTTVTDFSNLVTSSSSVTISGHNLDLSDQYIEVNTLTINYTGTLSKIGATVSDLSDLIVNGTSYGAQGAGMLFDWIRQASGSRLWVSITSSADGTKLAAVAQSGQIYTSVDSGVTWTARDSSRQWTSITSSADGTKLAAGAYNGQIYTSTDSGATWTAQASGSREWLSVTSSADGTKLAAAVQNGQIYTSVDSGITWTARESSRNWRSITSSSDGTKLATVVRDGQIYTSVDSGITWIARESSRNWKSITSSSDGTKLAAFVRDGQIYTSTDSGTTWTARDSNRNWYSITSSADGTKLAAVVWGGQIYTSIDSGVTWTARASGSRQWYSITSSADGTKLAAAVLSSQIYTHEDEIKTLSVDILTPQASTYISWSPIVSWGNATSCYYSYDNFVSTSTANCASLGSDISNPGLGSHTLSVKGIDTNGVIVQKDISFTLSLGITITAPISGSTITSWNPVVNWDPNSVGNITNCYYSYDNFVSTSTANCLSIGSDILPPTTVGTTTFYLKVIDSNGSIGTNSITFVNNISLWISRDSIRNWRSITSSYDGTKLAAVVYGGQIYTSTNSGVTWTARNSNRNWYSITSSADGTKLAAVVWGGQIYTSTDSGITWTARESSAVRRSITSSADGTKLATAVYGGQIYTSTDSGVTWTAQASGSRNWISITSSADGTKLAAGVWGAAYIYTSSDSGVTWTQRGSTGDWAAISMSGDGQYIAAVKNYGGNIYLSNDYGVTWSPTSFTIQGSLTAEYSDDGSTLVVAVGSDVSIGQIYISKDHGSTWTTEESVRKWYGATLSSDGNKIAAVAYDGKIYTKNTESSTTTISISRPSSDSSVLARAWSVLVNWGSSVSCYYSYNNWVSTSTVNCANNGSDISYPSSRGANTLSIKGLNSNGTTTNESVSFDFDLFFSTWTARDSLRNWGSITSSSDGTKLAAVANGGQIYTSTDSGVTWTARDSSRIWRSITLSADGTKLAATVDNGQIYTSVDSGVTWTAQASGSRSWRSITSSADGTKLAAVGLGIQIYTSTDSGITWTARDSSRQWQSITSSYDGTKLAAVVYGGQIYTSTNSGVTWTARNSNRNWYSITSSADGTKLAAVVYNGQIYTSTDSGVTWTARDSNRTWQSITSSADGTKLAAGAYNGQIYTSTDSGATWTAQASGSRAWQSITSSADGTKLVAGVYGGQIYTSASTPYIMTPTASSTISSWSPAVDWVNSITCEYSYDNLTWSNASCDGTGSDISAPSNGGSKTLYTKATDFQNIISTSSVSFTYSVLSGNSVSSCGIISTPGTYTLTQNITDVSGTCFVVNTNNVTINGAGYTVTAAGGNTSYAVTSGSYTGLTLSNINFSGFGQGDVSASQSITYSGTDIDLSNSTTTVSSLVISYTNSLTALNTYFSNLTSLIINNIDLGSFVAGLFTWSEQNISTCQTISSSGIYTLTADISDVSGTCFNITSDRVVIDGNNHTISGANGNTDYVIVATQTNANAYTGIGIKNLTLTGFGGGVDAHGADGVTGDVLGKNGGAVSLYNVTFPTNTVSINTKGGNAFYENNTTAQGGNAGNVKVTNSTVGTINVSGGDTVGDLLVGYDNGTVNGGSVGTVTNTNSTIILTLSNQGFGYIPGCMDNGFDSYDSAATYDDGSCTDIAIGSERDNPLGNTVTGPIDFYYYNNYGIVDGDANFYDNEVNYNNGGGGYNYGTTTGFAYFYNGNYYESGTDNYGYVGNGASFGYYSSNYGTVTGTTTFEYGYNYGTINGNADFTQGGLYAGYNYGTVNGDATFYSNDDYYGIRNTGTVTGTIYTIYGCTDPLAANYDATSLYDHGGCVYYGTNSDLPEGVTYTGDVIFQYGYSNHGTVNGNATFQNGGVNYGTTTGDVTFYDYYTGVSHDSGDNTLYVDGSFNYYGTGIVGGIMYDANSTVINSINFSNGVSNDYTTQGNAELYTADGSTNYGTITGNAIFYGYYTGPAHDSVDNTLYVDGSFNYLGTGVVDGLIYDGNGTGISTIYFSNGQSNDYTTQGNADFTQGGLYAGYNYGTVNGDATFYSNDDYYGIRNTGTVTGTIYTIYGCTDPLAANYDATSLYDHGGCVYYGTNSDLPEGVTYTGDVIFQYGYSNHGTVNGNVIFNDTTFNNGSVIGSAIFNTTYYASTTPTGGVMSFETADWTGSVDGQVLGSDSDPITTYVFYGNTKNTGNIVGNAIFYDNSYNAGNITGNVLFNNTASNNGTINGDALFNGTTFSIGTVNGTTTLGALSQTIQGVSNVINFVKNMITRDTLYLTQGSTLNISGLATLLGANANTLLTIRSTSATTNANLNINGTSNIDFLRLKNISNSGLSQDVSSQTVFDDGSNSGFVFKTNSTPSTRGGITGSYTPPALPVSRGGTPTTPPPAPTPTPTPTRTTTTSGTLDKFFIKNVAPLLFKDTPIFNIFSNTEIFKTANVGATVIPKIFRNLMILNSFKLTKIPTGFLNNASKFVLNKDAKLDLFTVKSNGNLLKANVKYDKILSTVTQSISTQTNQKLDIKLNTKTKTLNGTFDKQPISFNKGNLSITTPSTPGIYLLKADNSPVTLSIQVTEPVKAKTEEVVKKRTLWGWVKGLFR